MTSEQIKKLRELQNDIDEAQKAYAEVCKASTIAVRMPLSTSFNDFYFLPVKKIPLLEEELKILMKDWIREHLDELLKMRNDLVLCLRDENVTYTPTDI